MFGYVNICKDELKIKDFTNFRAYYCGLCKSLGRRHNQFVRLGLSYDFTFFAILLDSVNDGETQFRSEGCIKHFGRKKTVVQNSAVDFAADMSVLLTYCKLLDDVADDKSIKALVASIPYRFALRRMKKKYPDIADRVRDNLNKLSRLESEKCACLDEACEPFAAVMADIFTLGSPSLRRIGYDIGRFVYLADACDDMSDDFEKKKYNPMNEAYRFDGGVTDDIRNAAENSLYITMSAVAHEYEGLPVFKNKPILDNIIYLGIRANADRALNKLSKNNRKDQI